MKNIIKIIFIITVIFITTLAVLDYFLGFFLVKDIKIFQKYKVEVTKKSNLGVTSTKEKTKELGVKNIDGYPYWEFEYRGPYLNYKKNKSKNCRVIGIGDSIIWGSGVEEEDSYFHLVSNNIKNAEFINIAIPGSMPLQQIIRLEKEDLLNDTNLLIWQIWHDDFEYFTFSEGVLYNSKVLLNDKGNVSLFNNMPKSLNSFLINYSVIYNKILKVSLSNQISNKSKDVTEEFILEKIKKQSEDFLSVNSNNKIIFLFSHYLGTKYKKNEDKRHIYMYKKFLDYLGDNKKILLLDTDDLLEVKDLSPYNYDDVHYNEEGNRVVGEKLYNYIKTNKLLDEKCY